MTNNSFAWLGTSLSFGVAIGSGIAGIDVFDAKTAMLLPAGYAIIGVILALSMLKLLIPARSSHGARLPKDARQVKARTEE